MFRKTDPQQHLFGVETGLPAGKEGIGVKGIGVKTLGAADKAVDLVR
jgi:hypothetical protein